MYEKPYSETIAEMYEKSIQIGMHDAIVDGMIIRDIPSKLAFVSSSNELDYYSDLPPGSIVATYGFTSMWQLKPDKTWAVIVGGES